MYSKGRPVVTVIKNSNYFGLLYVNTASTGSYYFFDDILVTGNKAVDKELPIWNQFNIEAIEPT